MLILIVLYGPVIKEVFYYAPHKCKMIGELIFLRWCFFLITDLAQLIKPVCPILTP